VDWLANAITVVFEWPFRLFGGAGWAPLALVSVLAGVLLLWLFKLTTNQSALTARRRRLTGHLYELGLYQDHLGTLARVQWDLLKANLRYLATSLPALLVLVPVMVLIVVQLDARYQRRGLLEGESMLISASALEGREAVLPELTLSPGPGLSVEAGPVVDTRDRSVWWRVKADRDTPLGISVKRGAASWNKQLGPATAWGHLAGTRERGGWHHLLLNPAETPLPDDAPLAAIAADLPRRDADWMGLPVWLWGFFGLSIVGGLAFKRILNVQM